MGLQIGRPDGPGEAHALDARQVLVQSLAIGIPSEIFTSDIIMHQRTRPCPWNLLVGGHAVLDALSSLPGAEVEVDLLSLIDGLDDELVKHYGGAQADQKNHKRD